MAAMLSVMSLLGLTKAFASGLLPPLPDKKPLIYRAETIAAQVKGIPTYPVRRFDYVYQLPHPEHMPGRRLDQTIVELVKTDWGYATSQEGFGGGQSLRWTGLKHQVCSITAQGQYKRLFRRFWNA